MATLTTLQGNVAGRLGLNNVVAASGGDRDYITGWLNEGVIDVLRRTHCYVKEAAMTMTANVSDFTLDAAILAIDELYVTSGGQGYPLEPRPARSVIRMRLSSTTSSPCRYYALLGNNLLTFYPTPSANDTLTVFYVPRPTAMSSGSDDPSSTTFGGIPSEYHPAVECYAMWKAAAYKKDQASAQGERYRIEYEGQDGHGGRVAGIKRDLSHKAGRPLGYFMVPPSDVGLPAHDPSQDFGRV